MDCHKEAEGESVDELKSLLSLHGARRAQGRGPNRGDFWRQPDFASEAEQSEDDGEPNHEAASTQSRRCRCCDKGRPGPTEMKNAEERAREVAGDVSRQDLEGDP